jgi:hypothetical protein
MNAGKLLTIVTALLFVAPIVSATIVHVPSEQPTIQAAFLVLELGDTVQLAPGTYSGEGFVNLRPDDPLYESSFTIMSETEPEETVIQLDGSNFLTIPTFGSAKFRGLTFEGGDTVIHAETHGHVIARNCVFRDNAFGLTEDWGHREVRIDSCWFEGNGTAIQTTEYETSLTVTNSVFLDNYYAIHAQSYNNDIIGNLFIDNYQGLVCYGSGCDCWSTLYGSDISNNLFYGGYVPEWVFCEIDAFTCNNLFLSWQKKAGLDDIIGINGNISEDPLFCDTSLHTFDVYGGSPLLPENNACSTMIGMAQYGCFDCGDIDGLTGTPDIADLIYLVTYMFQNGPAPRSFEACDVDGNGTTVPDIADLIYLVTFMFQEGPDLQCP